MTHVISMVLVSAWTDDPICGLVVSDDNYAVLPIPPLDQRSVRSFEWDYQNLFEQVPPDADQKVAAVFYNTIIKAMDVEDIPDGDFEKAVADLTEKLNKLPARTEEEKTPDA